MRPLDERGGTPWGNPPGCSSHGNHARRGNVQPVAILR